MGLSLCGNLLYNIRIKPKKIAAGRKGETMGKRVEIGPNVFFEGKQTTKFKTACFSLSLIRPLCREEAAMNALLPSVLLRGTENYPDICSISAFLDEMYGASIGALVRKNGQIQTTGFYASFLEDRFAAPDARILESMVDFLRELLLEPKLEEGCFPQDFVEGEKLNLQNTIESALNDKRYYASQRMLELLCGDDGYGISRLGTVEEVGAITPGILFDHYQKILGASQVEIFYCGSLDVERAADLFRRAFGTLGTTDPTPVCREPFHPGGPVRRAEEVMDVAQGKLAMGFSTDCRAGDPEFPALMVLNAVYGSGMTCKLFETVREKLSLCYSISTVIHGAKGLMTLSSGIDTKDLDRVQAEIRDQLEACCRGEISVDELDAAKQGILASLTIIGDSPSQMEDYALYRTLSGQNMDIEAYEKAISAVTVEDTVRAAQKIRLEAVYFLRGPVR